MRKKVSLTEGKPLKVLLLFSLPMIISVTLQQFYNICDSFIAGKFISDNALAAISASYPITMIYLAMATGFGIGVNIVTARFIGEKDYEKAGDTIKTALTVVICSGIIVGFLAYFLASPLLALINCKEEYFNDAVIYLQFYSIGMLFLFLYNTVTNCFQALGNSRIPLYLLIGSTAFNAGLDLLLVIVCKMGVRGLALATFSAQALACVVSFIILLFYAKSYLKITKHFIVKRLLSNILVIAVPSIIQASIISIGQVCIQSLINDMGSSVTSGYGASYKLCYVIVNIYTMMSNAISTFTSQNAGASEYERIKKGFLSGFMICLVLTVITTILFMVIPRQLLSIFNNENTTEEVVEVGVTFIYCVAPFFVFLCVKIPCDGVLKGSKDMRSFMIATFADLIVRVLLSFILAPSMGYLGVFISWPIGWFVGMCLSLFFYYRGRWKKLIGYDTIVKKEVM